MNSTNANWKDIARLRETIQTAEAIIIGAGAGLSTSAGFSYSGRRFKENFPDFIAKYGFSDDTLPPVPNRSGSSFEAVRSLSL